MNESFQHCDADPHAFDLYNALAYCLFQPQRGSSPESIALAFTSANPREGVTQVVNSLVRSIHENSLMQATAVDARWLKSQPTIDTSPARSSEYRHSFDSFGGWERRKRLVDELRERAQIVVIDCSALSVSSDALSLAPVVDGIVLIVEAERTTKAEIRWAESRIGAAGGKMIGVVLNKQRFAVPTFLSRWLKPI